MAGSAAFEELRTYEPEQRAEALAYRKAATNRARTRSQVEVALLTARSEAQLRSTHARYFSTAAQLAG